MQLACPLCAAPAGSEPFHADSDRTYYRCGTCSLAYVPPHQRLPLSVELARYALHENRLGDPGYERHLWRLGEPVVALTRAGARGLDYGCGQAPALAEMLTRAERPSASYDPHFAPHDELLQLTYDFVTCSEVVEHVHDPLPLFERFNQLVKRGGLVALMTGMYDAAGTFGEWWYRRDPTHVCFYSADTLRWIASRLGWSVKFAAGDVTIFATGATA